jgi:hypothetical protein
VPAFPYALRAAPSRGADNGRSVCEGCDPETTAVLHGRPAVAIADHDRFRMGGSFSGGTSAVGGEGRLRDVNHVDNSAAGDDQTAPYTLQRYHRYPHVVRPQDDDLPLAVLDSSNSSFNSLTSPGSRVPRLCSRDPPIAGPDFASFSTSKPRSEM